MATANIPTSGGDLEAPTKELLTGIGVLGPDSSAPGNNKVTLVHGTPVSLQKIESGALSITKGWSSVVAAVGGLSGLGTLFTGFWGGQSPDERMALYGCAAVFISVTVVAVAIIVRSDVMARAQAQSAEYAVRAAVTSAIIMASSQSAPAPAEVAVPAAVQVPPADDGAMQFNLLADSSHVRVAADGTLEIEVDGQNWIPISVLRKASKS